MPRPSVPSGYWRLPPSATIRQGDLFYNHVYGFWSPCTFTVGARVEHWGLTVIRPFPNFQITLSGFNEFSRAARKAAMSVDDFQREFRLNKLRAIVAGEGRISEATHRVEGEGTGAIR